MKGTKITIFPRKGSKYTGHIETHRNDLFSRSSGHMFPDQENPGGPVTDTYVPFNQVINYLTQLSYEHYAAGVSVQFSKGTDNSTVNNNEARTIRNVVSALENLAKQIEKQKAIAKQARKVLQGI